MEISTLPITPVDPDSPIPLYHQIEMDLRALIATKKLHSDDMLPPEQELCRAYGVGRHTMRMALSRLVADNLIARKAGRGTVIKALPNPTRFYLDRSFTRQIEEMGLKPRSEVLEVTTGKINLTAPRLFHNKVGADYLHLKRLRYGNDQPIGLQIALILTELCPGLEFHDFATQSFYEVLNRHYNLLITELTHVVSATTADKEFADLLQVLPGDALLVVKTTAFVNDHKIIEHTISYYRADRYEFSTTHTYDGG
ncbi:MAG: GntR family transcriptional regulator [Chitinophagaceae bacterium]|nr:GntR family transcriptional regulator [Anaerolineae bacterium]